MSTTCLVLAGVVLAGCGQRGPLYLPTEPAAVNRATLPDLVRPAQRAPDDSAPAPERAK